MDDCSLIARNTTRSSAPLLPVLVCAAVGLAAVALTGCSDDTAQPPLETAAQDASSSYTSPYHEAKAQAAGLPAPAGATLHARGITLQVPAPWTGETPANSMRLAQFALPHHPDVKLVISGGIKGSVQANLDRWAAQVSDTNAHTVSFTLTDGVTAHGIAARGTFASGLPMDNAAPQPNSLLLGGIIEGGPQGLVFIKVVGPEDVLGPQQSSLYEMLKGASLSK